MADGKKLDPIISEFDTQEDADAYDRWFRATVERAMKDTRPGIPHDEVMAKVREAIQKSAEAKASKRKRA